MPGNPQVPAVFFQPGKLDSVGGAAQEAFRHGRQNGGGDSLSKQWGRLVEIAAKVSDDEGLFSRFGLRSFLMISSSVCLFFFMRVPAALRAASSHNFWISFRGALHIHPTTSILSPSTAQSACKLSLHQAFMPADAPSNHLICHGCGVTVNVCVTPIAAL